MNPSTVQQSAPPPGSTPTIQASERLGTLLLAYTLCNEAVDHSRVLKDHVTHSMFWTGVVTYYSVFKDRDGKDREWFKEILSVKRMPDGLTVLLRHSTGPDQERRIRDSLSILSDIFDRFRKLRNQNLAHKDPNREPEDTKEWLRIPPQVAGSDSSPGTFYVVGRSLPALSDIDKLDFIALVGATIDIVWQFERLPIWRRVSDGTVRQVPAEFVPLEEMP